MKNIIKKTLSVLVIILLITVLEGCGGGDAKIKDPKTYDGGLFTININPDWKVITKSDFYAEVPDETLVAFSKPDAYNGFFINVNVSEETLTQEISAIDYGRANITLAAQNLTDYQKADEAEIDLDGSKGMVHIFQARLNPTEKLTRFIQLYTTKGKKGYIVSGGMLPDTPEDIRNEVGASVTSFRLK